ncbi:MAG: methyltransferase domain-containing protein [Anaerolineales bacterium]|jgi:ubiquinone/menaquinone biosynthesis C-methylase UbiE
MNELPGKDPNTEHAELNERKWDSRAATFDQKRFDYFRWMQRRVIGLIDLKPGCHFLDIGCGTGWAVRYVASLLQGEGEFCGVDISGAMIETAQAQLRGFKNVYFYKTSAEQLPPEDGSVDFAICTNSFHHYLNPSKVLAEIYRVLRTEGRFYILDVTADDPLIRLINDRVGQREPEHVKFYCSQEYRTLSAAARLKYLNGKWIAYPVKVHISEKVALAG